jgi:preprotein translocase SecE subunit
MRKVSWPSRHETLRLSGVVLALCIMVTVYLSVLGYVFDMFVNLMTKGRV